MTIRRVRMTRHQLGEHPIDVQVLSPTGDHVLMTVEEYRERIRSSYTDGRFIGLWSESDTKRQLDADLSGEVKP